MKKLKRFLVLTLAMVMAFTMNIAVFAEGVDGDAPTTAITDTATITVNGLSDGATLKYLPLIVANPEVAGGWEIINGEDEIGDLDEFKDLSEKEQTEKVKDLDATEDDGVVENVITVSNAGMYLIKVTPGEDDEYIYAPMLAYVQFEYENGVAKLVDQEINAKRAKNTLVKTAEIQFLERNETVGYTVTGHIPYVPAGVSTDDEDIDYLFAIEDVLTGGEYVTENDKVIVTATLDGDDITLEDEDIILDEDTNTLTLVFDSLIDEDNTNAQKELVVKYEAKLTGETVMENSATPIFWDKRGDTVSYKAVAGKVELEKTDEDENGLEGAKFVISRVIDGNTMYAEFETVNQKTLLKGWVDDYKNGDDFVEDCLLTTGSDGKVEAYGFDRDLDGEEDETFVYTAKEVYAPTGYSVAEDTVLAWQNDKFEEADVVTTIIDEQVALAAFEDETLIELPFTGGTGTKAFTIGGIILMSLASALYFFTKKRTIK